MSWKKDQRMNSITQNWTKQQLQEPKHQKKKGKKNAQRIEIAIDRFEPKNKNLTTAIDVQKPSSLFLQISGLLNNKVT